MYIRCHIVAPLQPVGYNIRCEVILDTIVQFDVGIGISHSYIFAFRGVFVPHDFFATSNSQIAIVGIA